MNKDLHNLLTDICETRGPLGERMADALERVLYAILHGEPVKPMHDAVTRAMKDPDVLEQWEEDK